MFQVKGVLLDKAATAIVVCCLSVKFTPTGGSIDLKEVDYSGRYFDSSSLCLLIRTVCIHSFSSNFNSGLLMLNSNDFSICENPTFEQNAWLGWQYRYTLTSPNNMKNPSFL